MSSVNGTDTQEVPAVAIDSCFQFEQLVVSTLGRGVSGGTSGSQVGEHPKICRRQRPIGALIS